MRYRQFYNKIAKLDRQIDRLLAKEHRLSAGKGPWYMRLAPKWRARVLARAAAKREGLAELRTRLEKEMFAASALLWNFTPSAVFRRTVPAGAEAVATLRAAANAAIGGDHGL
jgi:hypothetical protein